MAKTISVTIDTQLDDFISQLIATGRYSSTSEVVRSALTLLQREEKQLVTLRQLVIFGEQSGSFDLTLSQIAAQVKQKHNV